ncbi:MAG: undecaprenyl-phosphate glucose phosphotransferase [Oscillospiraceae bacterium]|nr:undecaprenyl-phosphate glucose phosphotransferase [Oscillospiraceae bacterium]
MIKENQQLLNRLNVLSDAAMIFLTFPAAFWLRFYVLPNGVISVPMSSYYWTGAAYTLLQLFTFAAFGLYRSFRHVRLRRELPLLWAACLLDLAIMLSWLFLSHADHYSREALGVAFLLALLLLSGKRYILRKTLRRLRQKGYNLKHVVLIGDSPMARRYADEIENDRELGYHLLGYVSAAPAEGWEETWLGDYGALETVLDEKRPDEVVSAVRMADYDRTGAIIAACEKTGSRLSIIPFYSEFMASRPNFDDLNGLPLLNIRYIPLENWANAFIKRAMDLVGSALILLLFSPLMLFCAIGVKLSSPGPVIFRQERVGLNKKPFMMYKFRSMRVNDEENTAWSGKTDDRRTRFGSFLRKYSLDEFPQFWNVLKGDMSLVGPRPELPFFVDRFKEEVPLYMVKHQVRPGITGWAQVNGLRGDTSIKERIEHDLYYIENWSLGFDLKILWMTVFGGKFKNEEV